jgi:molybdopterin-guanine dinucleotide biosynthesis protein B
MKIFGLVGWSGSGKTTLLALFPELIGRGLRVSTMKHTHHSVDLDRRGKDSFRHREAGATEVVLLSSSRWTLMHELRGSLEPTPEQMIPRLAPVDLLLVEGFKKLRHDKLEIWRRSASKPPLFPEDEHIVAVASDAPLAGVSLPCFALDEVPAIADFVLAHCGLSPRRGAGDAPPAG